MKQIVVSACLFLTFSLLQAQNTPKEVVWGDKIKKAKFLRDFIDINNGIFVYNSQTKSVEKYNTQNFTSEKSVLLDKVKVKLGSHEIDLMDNKGDLIEYQDGLGLQVEHFDKKTKTKYYGVVKISETLNINKVADVIYKVNTGPKFDYYYSEIQHVDDDYQAFLNYNTTEKWNKELKRKEMKIGLVVKTKNGNEVKADFSKYDTYSRRARAEQRSFAPGDGLFSVVKWTDKTTTAKIYDAKTGDLIKDLDLRSFMEGVDSRIISSKRLKNGDCVLAGFYGRFTEEKNEVAGIFKIVLNPDGDIIEKSSDTFLMTEIQSTQEKSSIEKIVITDSGNLFLVLGSKRLDKYIDVFEQLMVVGIKSDEIWTKSIPINHDMGNIVYSAYLDVEVHNSGEKIYIAYNDHPDNVKSYDYNNYKYSEKNKPAQYKNTVPSSCTILEIDQFGKVVPYSIDLNTAFTNLKESVLLENGKFFLTTNMYSVGGASKPKFVLVEL